MSALPSTLNSYQWQRWLFTSAVVLQLLLASASIGMISSVRVLVSGESLWSKGLSAALIHLQRYAESGSALEYQHFEQALHIPLGVGHARATLDSGQPDRAVIRQGLLQGENHPNDVNYLQHVLPWVWDLELLRPSIAIWREGDRYVAMTENLGQRIWERRSEALPLSPIELDSWRIQISEINQTALTLAKDFSATLGGTSRTLSTMLLGINLLTALLLCLLYGFSVKKALAASTKAHNTLEQERQRSNATLAALGDGVLTLDPQLHIQYANPAAEALFDIPAHTLRHYNIEDILGFAPELIRTLQAAPTNEITQSRSDDKVYWISRPGKENRAVRISISTLEQTEHANSTVMVLHDVSQIQSYMRMLEWQESHDALTGLYNRSAFERTVGQAVSQQPASLLQLNLDHFKMVNATYGHSVGDEVLRQVCHMLRAVLRDSDILARTGGDEFAVLLTNCPPSTAMQTAERLRKNLHELDVHWQQKNLHTGVSIGIVHIPSAPDHDVQALLDMADRACRHAKESGRNRIMVYDPLNRIFQRYQGDLEWVQRLQSSLENNQLTLMAQTVYPLQPQHQSMNGLHFEVLLRMNDGSGALIPPDAFIPIAERYDLMPHIDRWVIRHTLTQLRRYLDQGIDISTCSINLSGASLNSPELMEFVRYHLVTQGISAEKLCFEITETSAIANLESATSMMMELRKLGCRFALDDFGSGMASFKYLQQLPVDYLKIDGSFVQNMLANPSDHAMVKGIQHIANLLGKTTVAEFVADAATFATLQTMGVDFAQGYYVAPPVPLNGDFFACASRPPPQLASTYAN